MLLARRLKDHFQYRILIIIFTLITNRQYLKPPLDKLVNRLYIYWGWPRRPRSCTPTMMATTGNDRDGNGNSNGDGDDAAASANGNYVDDHDGGNSRTPIGRQ
jgi:hypothetical protein